jgi:uncharacterized membrane protein YdjX (TVP38/TMEM64 family)
MPTSRAYKRHILFFSGIVAVAGLIAASDVLYAKSEEIIALAETVISQSPLLGMLLFVLLAMASAMLSFFSSAILVPVGVYAWGTTVSFILLWIGWFLGGMSAFGIGRYLGRSVVSKLIGEARISDFEERLSRRTRFIHILLFQAALPSEIPGYLLGILRYRFPLYLVALAMVELPYAIGTVYLGASFLRRESGLVLLLGMGGVLVSVFAYQLFRRIGTVIASRSRR